MQLKRSELVPIAEAFSDLSGPVAAGEAQVGGRAALSGPRSRFLSADG